MHLAVASSAAMATALGPSAAAIRPLLDRYCAAVSNSHDTALLLIDDPASMAGFGMSPVATTSEASVRASLAGAQTSLNSRGDQIDSVLLFGGHRVFPFFEFL